MLHMFRGAYRGAPESSPGSNPRINMVEIFRKTQPVRLARPEDVMQNGNDISESHRRARRFSDGIRQQADMLDRMPAVV